MKRKRLDRDLKWGFQHFPYYQLYLDHEIFKGLVSLITLTDGKYYYWNFPKAGKTPVCGKGMVWLQLIPDQCSRLITAMLIPQEKVVNGKKYPYSISAIYVDVAERFEYDPDGVAAYVDKYLDVKLTPQGDIMIDDRDELDEAFESGELTEKQYADALCECNSIINQMGANLSKTEEWCLNILDMIQKRIANGLKPMENRISCQNKMIQ